MRPTLLDVAREAGVSGATVDRVLNNRRGVRQRTREVVLDAAQRLGYVGNGAAANDDEAAAVVIDVVFPAGSNTFIRELREQLELQSSGRAGVETRIHSIEGFNPTTLANTLAALEGRSNATALVSLDHPAVREAIRALSASGVPVITLLSDVHHVPRVGYIGIDNRSAGRLAGYLVGRLLGRGRRKVALFAGSLAYRGHEEREMGFRHILLEEFPELEIIDLTEVRDDTEQAYDATLRHLRDHPDMAAIYNIGAGNRGIARALEESGLAGSVVFIGHELTVHTKRFLLSGVMDATIDQNARLEAHETLEQLVRVARGQDFAMRPLPISVYFRENLPES